MAQHRTVKETKTTLVIDDEIDKPHSNCGIVGIYTSPDASTLAYYALHALQHRGQEASGIVTQSRSSGSDNKQRMKIVKGRGLVTDVFSEPEIFDFPEGIGKQEVINVEQWFTYLALDALVGNQEGGLPTGRADDCAIYRGVIDPRFVLIPHDFDTCFNLNNDDNLTTPSGRSIFSFHTGSASLLGLQRLFTHPDLVPVYYQKLLHLVNNVFTRPKLDPLVDELLGG